MKRLLIARQHKLGEVVMATPVFRSLREIYPVLQMDAWFPASSARLFKASPWIDEFVPTSIRPDFNHIIDLVLDLRRRRYDAILLLAPNSGNHTILARLAKIPIRCGSSNRRYARFLTHNLIDKVGDDTYPLPPGQHQVERNLAMASSLVGAPLPLSPMFVNIDSMARTAMISRIGTEPYAMIHPGTGGTSRPWGAEKYREVAKALLDHGLRVVLTGTGSEHALTCAVADGIDNGRIIHAVDWQLDELAALTSMAAVVISGNTAPAHIAAAYGRPVVMIEPSPIAEERLRRWGPWMTPHRSFGSKGICNGCTPRNCTFQGSVCVDGIDPASVVAGIFELIRF